MIFPIIRLAGLAAGLAKVSKNMGALWDLSKVGIYIKTWFIHNFENELILSGPFNPFDIGKIHGISTSSCNHLETT
jgi:hypothetical protein